MMQSAVDWLLQHADSLKALVVQRTFWLGVAGGAIGLLIITVLIRRKYRLNLVSVSLPFNLGTVEYELSSQDRVLAWKMYVQLKTRKAALLFDENHDVISEVYSSLYDIFPVARELLSNMPLAEVERSKGVADLILRVLNDAIRPHMTVWQASFRRWWEREVQSESNKGKSPCDIQRSYPQYSELVADLNRTNTELAKLADELLVIARARPLVSRGWAWFRRKPAIPTPTQPTKDTSKQIQAKQGTAVLPGPIPPTQPYDGAINTSLAADPPKQEASA
ncbi:hypothetical protein B7486_42365 [cyanobacterium TDX16]|nr:hypothetical protein B7486_42365 [cyanobacterium TDX16]